jgi:hypothetical protein
LRTEHLDQQTVSLSSDTLAVLEHASSATVRLFDAAQGQQQGEPFSHALEVRSLALSQAGTAAGRQLALIDRNRDLHLLDCTSRAAVKLASMVEAAVWHDASDMLVAVADDKLLVWHCPAAAFIDPDLLPATRVGAALRWAGLPTQRARVADWLEASLAAYSVTLTAPPPLSAAPPTGGLQVAREDAAELGKGAQVAAFSGARCLLKRRDGAQVALAVAPHPAALHGMVRLGQWDAATRLCRCAAACAAAPPQPPHPPPTPPPQTPCPAAE